MKAGDAHSARLQSTEIAGSAPRCLRFPLPAITMRFSSAPRLCSQHVPATFNDHVAGQLEIKNVVMHCAMLFIGGQTLNELRFAPQVWVAPPVVESEYLFDMRQVPLPHIVDGVCPQVCSSSQWTTAVERALPTGQDQHEPTLRPRDTRPLSQRLYGVGAVLKSMTRKDEIVCTIDERQPRCLRDVLAAKGPPFW